MNNPIWNKYAENGKNGETGLARLVYLCQIRVISQDLSNDLLIACQQRDALKFELDATIEVATLLSQEKRELKSKLEKLRNER